MKSLILIPCILSDGEHFSPRGEYQTFKRCDELVERFETELFPSYAGKEPLCWCYRAPPAVPVPGRAKRYDARDRDEDRKSPKP